MSGGDLLPQSVLKNIGDKQYEKRKQAALEIEAHVKRLATANDEQRIRLIVDRLISEFAFSPQANHRKGALLCLAAATVGIGEPSEAHLRQIVPPVLASFTDQDSRVRYYACEALYNIAKVSREPFIIFFNEVFDAMFRLCADSEPNVQNAVQFLDNLVKDILTESAHFSVDGFIPKLRDYLRVVNPNKRQFLISWITVLDSVPDLNMLAYLPQLLDGLMSMLSDSNREIRVAAHKAMMEFLIEIHASRMVDFGALSRTLVDKSSSQDEFTRLTAIKWLKEFVEMASGQLLDMYPQILGAVLLNISHPSKEIQQVSHEANNALLSLQPVEQGGGQVDTVALLSTISRELRSEAEPTRLEALRWVHFLLHRSQQQVLDHLTTLLPSLLDALSATNETTVLTALGVLASIAASPQQFRPVLISLLERFRGESGTLLLQRGGALVIRRLCGHMGPGRVFSELSLILNEEADLSFASTIVQALNLILLTSPEVRELRELLRDAGKEPRGAAFFASLYPCWSHSTGALLSLCFLAQAYDHASDLIQCFRTMPVGAEVLVQVDRLVQLLETPCFTFLRLQLLHPRQHPALLRAMYSLLMLLPQSNAFRTLNNRLQSIPTLAMMQLDAHTPSAFFGAGSAASIDPMGVTADSGAPASGGVARSNLGSGGEWGDFKTLLDVFCARQHKHFLAEERGGLQVVASGDSMGTGAGADAGGSGMSGSAEKAASNVDAGGDAAAAVVAETASLSLLGSDVTATSNNEPSALRFQEGFAQSRRSSNSGEDETSEAPFMPPPSLPDDGF